MKDKIRRYLTAAKLVIPHFKFAKNDLNYMNWFLTQRELGIPYEYRQDISYVKWFREYRSDLIKFKDIHKNEDCFIIGNGPSLNMTDLNKLNGYYVFGLNKIHLIFDRYPQLKLSYHAVVNSLVIEQIHHELNQNIFGCPSFLSFHASETINFSNKNIHKLITNNKWSFYKDLTQPICEGYTVTYVAMQIAFYMGFKNIYLIGVDHNFQQSGKPNEEQHMQESDVNHFHPDYFKGMQWHLADLEGNEASYALAKHQFHAAGRNIYDATVNGKLNVFEKIDYQKALLLAKKK